jgi:hypothetical protein
MDKVLSRQDVEDEKQEVFVGEDPPRVTKGIAIGIAISLLSWAVIVAIVIRIFVLK